MATWHDGGPSSSLLASIYDDRPPDSIQFRRGKPCLPRSNFRVGHHSPRSGSILLLNMSKKRRDPWGFDPSHLTWPYVIGVPGAFLVSAAIGIIAGDYIRWGGLVLFTTFIFGFFINDSRRFFRTRRFWLLTASLLSVHVAAFLAILLHIHEWKLLWFNVMILELPPFWLVRNLLLRDIAGE